MSTFKDRLYVQRCEVVSKLNPGLYLDEDACMFIDEDGQVYVGAEDEVTVAAMRRVLVDSRRQDLWKQSSVFNSIESLELTDDPVLADWWEAFASVMTRSKSRSTSLNGGMACDETTMASD